MIGAGPGFTAVDFAVVLIYLAGMTGLGLSLAGRQRTASDYFLGGRRIPWAAVMFSVVATETSTLTFISIPAVAYGGTLTFLQITLGYIAGRVAVGFLLLPRYIGGRLSTAYEYLGGRFGPGLRGMTSVTFMLTRLLADGVRLFASAIPIAIILRLSGVRGSDLSIYLAAILLIAGITLLYTLIGGIRAVVWMDVIQTGIYMGGAFLAVGILLSRVPGGIFGALETARAAGKLKLIDLGFQMSPADFFAEPYTLITALVGGAVFSIASHGTDQLIVQRLLATRNLREGRRALIGSGFVVMGQFALFLFVGILLFAFYGGASPEGLGLTARDEIFAKFIVEEIPSGLSGLIVAAILAAAMSTLSSSINSLASSAALDIYRPRRGREASPERLLRASRILSLGWGLILTGSAVLFAGLQLGSPGERPAVVELGLGIASYTYGGLLGVFLLGILFRRVDRVDAAVGFFFGLTSLLFLVKGPVQGLLPGEGLTLAWPLYTLVGAAIAVAAGLISCRVREAMRRRNRE